MVRQSISMPSPAAMSESVFSDDLSTVFRHDIPTPTTLHVNITTPRDGDAGRVPILENRIAAIENALAMIDTKVAMIIDAQVQMSKDKTDNVIGSKIHYLVRRVDELDGRVDNHTYQVDGLVRQVSDLDCAMDDRTYQVETLVDELEEVKQGLASVGELMIDREQIQGSTERNVQVHFDETNLLVPAKERAKRALEELGMRDHEIGAESSKTVGVAGNDKYTEVERAYIAANMRKEAAASSKTAGVMKTDKHILKSFIVPTDLVKAKDQGPKQVNTALSEPSNGRIGRLAAPSEIISSFNPQTDGVYGLRRGQRGRQLRFPPILTGPTQVNASSNSPKVVNKGKAKQEEADEDDDVFRG